MRIGRVSTRLSGARTVVLRAERGKAGSIFALVAVGCALASCAGSAASKPTETANTEYFAAAKAPSAPAFEASVSTTGKTTTRPSTRPEVAGWKAMPETTRAFALEFLSRIDARDWNWISKKADGDFSAAYPLIATGSSKVITYDGLVLARLIRAERSTEAPPDFPAGTKASMSPQTDERFLVSGDEGSVPKVISADVLTAYFQTAELKGPVAIFRGRFLLRDGKSQAFALHILWRLEPPRILGDRP